MLTVAGNFRPSAGFSLQYPIGSAKTCRRKLTLRERTMEIIRREFLRLSSLTVTVPSIANIALAQTQAGPKLTQILRNDLEGQGQVVQETVVSMVEFPSGAAAPWHMHPGAQELLHVIEGSLIVEIEGKERAVLEAGQAGIIPAELVHLARNESASAT